MLYRNLCSLLIVLACLPGGLLAQPPTPNSYPALNEPSTAEGRRLSALFDNHNTGNLHVYAAGEIGAATDEYFFSGSEITTDLYRLFPNKQRRALNRSGVKAYATKAIRGDNDAFYLVRTTGGKMGDQIDLYDLQNGQLRHLQTLSYYRCSRSKCQQMDSWIMDIDGDTRLDIIQKTSQSRGTSATASRERTRIYRQLNGGTFTPNNNLEVTAGDYNMEPIGRQR